MIKDTLFFIPYEVTEEETKRKIAEIKKQAAEATDDKTVNQFFAELKREYTTVMMSSTSDYYTFMKSNHKDYFLLYKQFIRDIFEKYDDMDNIVSAATEILNA